MIQTHVSVRKIARYPPFFVVVFIIFLLGGPFLARGRVVATAFTTNGKSLLRALPGRSRSSATPVESKTDRTMNEDSSPSSSGGDCQREWDWRAGQDQALSHAILPLSETSHKGSSGRIAVLGGCAQYTGAPYYAAMASLQTGADLAFVWTAQEATGPIKGYSPELMVSAVYGAAEMDAAQKERQRLQEQQQEQSTQKEDSDLTAQISANDQLCQSLIHEMVQTVVAQLDRIHCLIVGPGLGRCPLVGEAVYQILVTATTRALPVIVDADALFALSQLSRSQLQALFSNRSRIVLTPNAVEYQRFMAAAGDDEESSPSSSNVFHHAVMVRKQRFDAIEYQGQTMYTCWEPGGLKRSGGIGDVLAGTLGTLVAWNSLLHPNDPKDHLPLSCWTACCFVKRATARAFAEKHRAMTAPDVLQELGPAIYEMTESTE